jgi:putative glutathione S-transferase
MGFLVDGVWNTF